jgi:hypothetical protein
MNAKTQQHVFYKGKINCIDNNNIGIQIYHLAIK